MYSNGLGESDRFAEAHAAIDSANKYLRDDDPLSHTVWWFRDNDYDAVDRAWQYAEQSNKPDRRLDALWTHVIASRTQGRMRDALAAAREYTRYRRQHGPSNAADALLEAVVLAENGRPRESAALYDSMARPQRAVSPSRSSAKRAWYWTHEAGAAATAGDTATLRRLEDSVRASGALATERSKRLHHYVRGLRLELEHRPADAVAAFRLALWVRQNTHVRIYAGLARSLIAAGRPREAVAPLMDALRGPVSAAGLYATRTELQELLALAYDKSGQHDSALTQYKLVSRAWRHADPQFDQRRAVVEARIATLTYSVHATSQRSMAASVVESVLHDRPMSQGRARRASGLWHSPTGQPASWASLRSPRSRASTPDRALPPRSTLSDGSSSSGTTRPDSGCQSEAGAIKKL